MSEKLNWVKIAGINGVSAKSYKHDCVVNENPEEDGKWEYSATCCGMIKTSGVAASYDMAISYAEEFIEQAFNLIDHWNAYRPTGKVV